MLAAVGLVLVYPLIAIAFLHEWGVDNSPFSNAKRAPASAPPHTVKAAVEPEGAATSEWRPPGVPLLLAVPGGWDRSVVGSALVLAPTDAASEVMVSLYFERGDRSLAETARSAAGYLDRVAGDAPVSKPYVATIAGRHAMCVRAKTKQTVHKATVWILDGVRYLVVEQLQRSAKPELKTEEHQLVASLRPARG